MGGFQMKITRIMSSRSARDYEEEDDYIKRSRSEHVEGFNNLELDLPGQDLSVKPQESAHQNEKKEIKLKDTKQRESIIDNFNNWAIRKATLTVRKNTMSGLIEVGKNQSQE